MVKLYGDLQSYYAKKCQPMEDKVDSGELALFLSRYLEQVDRVSNLISSRHYGEWEAYLDALENIIKYLFAHDFLNYARLMPVHLAQMNALEKEDPETRKALKSGNFVLAKLYIPFTNLFTDQDLE